ncbi:hypothetical protein THASP1DRAFT_24461 [Thamnocephalis sphaerospora]|uniref:Uncharacterized protein n=1 Tax=Thamnocephalis sphaerospora TaxID=78915 RepID=A0A4P9XN83_9FUNG|nr:hypothetical protein THASP1DRAFT_24461 [Thamnocephalis sphaerospora]|eukprot:RKP07388.1 hypothetical protein THASP1DRAFT_24461 [Thamnocephalis sphaerospora]
MSTECQRSAAARTSWRRSSIASFIKQFAIAAVALTVVASVSTVDADSTGPSRNMLMFQRRAGPDCRTIDAAATCSETAGCAWWGTQCVRDVSCSMQNQQCSEGCMSCGGFGCVPQSRSCPAPCENIRSPAGCNVLASNSIGCSWDHSINACGYSFNGQQLRLLPLMPSPIGGLMPPPLSPSKLAGPLNMGPPASTTAKSPSGTSNNAAAQRPSVPAPDTASSPSPAAANPNGNANGGGSSDGAAKATGNPMDANAIRTTTDSSNKLSGALIGGCVAIVAVAGIAFLVVQQRLRARREMLNEQRSAEMHDVHPQHTRESLLPFVQRALGVGESGPTAPPAAAMR